MKRLVKRSSLIIARLAPLLALLLSPPPALARPRQTTPGASAPARDEADAYCEHVRGVAGSEGALVRSPWLFSTFGTLRGGSLLDAEGVASGATSELTLRLQAGLGFSPTRWYRADLIEARAGAECERYRAERELRQLLSPLDGALRSALDAKTKVLSAALPEAERLLAESSQKLDAARTTLAEHGALSLRVDDIRRSLAEARLALAALPPAAGGGSPAAAVFERLRRWEARRQELEGSLRKSGALELSLRGGYDELVNVEQRLPVFGSVTLEINPGWLWQGAEEERARRAHAEWIETRTLGAELSLAGAARQLEAQLAISSQREAELRTSLGDLELRLERLRDLESRQGREYAEYLWFDVVRLRAERAFFAERIRVLRRATASLRGPAP